MQPQIGANPFSHHFFGAVPPPGGSPKKTTTRRAVTVSIAPPRGAGEPIATCRAPPIQGQKMSQVRKMDSKTPKESKQDLCETGKRIRGIIAKMTRDCGLVKSDSMDGFLLCEPKRVRGYEQASYFQFREGMMLEYVVIPNPVDRGDPRKAWLAADIEIIDQTTGCPRPASEIDIIDPQTGMPGVPAVLGMPNAPGMHHMPPHHMGPYAQHAGHGGSGFDDPLNHKIVEVETNRSKDNIRALMLECLRVLEKDYGERYRLEMLYS